MLGLQNSLIAAAASIGALLASGCISVAGDGQRHSMMGHGHNCAKLMQATHEAEPGKSKRGETGMKCKMMDKYGAADAPSTPSVAPPEEHQHTPDAPAAAH